MRERGILFSDPMVRAILAGKKTQTRRAVRWPSWVVEADRCELLPTGICRVVDGRVVNKMTCPYGQPGDRLWVRETWRAEASAWGASRETADPKVRVMPAERWTVQYDADHSSRNFAAASVPATWHPPRSSANGNAPSIHMPRWASRITLEVTGIRVERAQSISAADVAAEGVDAEAVEALWDAATRKRRGEAWHPNSAPAFDAMRPRDLWRAAWTLINGRESWDANPWVWVVSFRRI